MVDGKIHRPGTFQPGVCVPPGLDDGDMVTSDYIINLHVKRWERHFLEAYLGFCALGGFSQMKVLFGYWFLKSHEISYQVWSGYFSLKLTRDYRLDSTAPGLSLPTPSGVPKTAGWDNHQTEIKELVVFRVIKKSLHPFQNQSFPSCLNWTHIYPIYYWLQWVVVLVSGPVRDDSGGLGENSSKDLREEAHLCGWASPTWEFRWGRQKGGETVLRRSSCSDS